MSTIETTGGTQVRSRILAVGIATAAALVVWAVAALAGVQLTVTTPLVGTLTIDAVLVAVSTLPIALAAWGVLALLERFTESARIIWTRIAIAVLVISLPPLAFLDASPATKVVLAIMHLTVGLVLIVMLRRRTV